MHENTKLPHECHRATQRDSHVAICTYGRQHAPMCFYVYLYTRVLQVSSFTKEPDSENEHWLCCIYYQNQQSTVNDGLTALFRSLWTWPRRDIQCCFTLEVLSGFWLPAAGRFRIHSSDIRHRGTHPPFPSGFSVREGSTRCWAENIWRRRA